MRTIMVTGGYGFIGTNFCLYWSRKYPEDRIIVVDGLTYAARPQYLHARASISFEFVDIRQALGVSRVLNRHKPDILFHFAAESHVCRSIAGPRLFYETNVLGTFNLIESWRELHEGHPDHPFIHVSTDEVFGELETKEPAFDELTPINPRSPYAASKAASDLCVLSYGTTYDVPVMVANCSNNFGLFQHEEKLIPATIKRLWEGQPVRLYGPGTQVRDWLYAEDTAEALDLMARSRDWGERYCIGGENEYSNREMVELIHDLFQEEAGRYFPLEVIHTDDRPTDDKRYAIDCTKIRQLGWEPTGPRLRALLRQTVRWYIHEYKQGAEVYGVANTVELQHAYHGSSASY